MHYSINFCLIDVLSLSNMLTIDLSLQVSDIRESQYEKSGIGSSYLFRLDDDFVVGDTDYFSHSIP
jgi:hypothetical protein